MARPDDIQSLQASVTMLVRVSNSHRARRRLEDRSGVPLGPTSVAALAAVVNGGPMRYGTVARHMGVQPSRVSKEARILIEAGYLVEHTDPADRRAMLLEATDKGIEAHRRYRDAAEDAVTEVLGTWSDREVHQLARLLARMADRFARVDEEDDT